MGCAVYPHRTQLAVITLQWGVNHRYYSIYGNTSYINIASHKIHHKWITILCVYKQLTAQSKDIKLSLCLQWPVYQLFNRQDLISHRSHLILCLHWQSTEQHSTVWYNTVRHGTRLHFFLNMRRLRGLAARTNHVRFNVAMPIDKCSSTEYWCSVRVRCLLYVV